MSFIRPFIAPVTGLLLRTLYSDRKRKWSQHDLARHLGVARETLRDELHVLQRAHVVTAEDEGRKRLYSADPRCPIHEELRSMLAKSYGIVEEIRELLVPYKSGIKWAFVQDFGIDLENAAIEPVAHVIGVIDYDDLRPRWFKSMNRLNRDFKIKYHALPFFEQHVRLRHPVALSVIDCEKIWLYGDPPGLQRLKRQRPRKGDQIWGPLPTDGIRPTS